MAGFSVCFWHFRCKCVSYEEKGKCTEHNRRIDIGHYVFIFVYMKGTRSFMTIVLVHIKYVHVLLNYEVAFFMLFTEYKSSVFGVFFLCDWATDKGNSHTGQAVCDLDDFVVFFVIDIIWCNKFVLRCALRRIVYA